ncbi:MAG TPA: helix-turn-helix domain-containing protein [Patescibacteria group bacterium]|nr:helix-turn-helix domain-containing protein [Patescibacteria group bacterium]
MRESKAKKRILEVADRMFREVGYANLNVNEIAREAEVSVGTLYYHFPDGKISILMEIRTQIAERYIKRAKERLDPTLLQETGSLEEGLGLLLETLIELHRGERFVLAAMESEVLSNLAAYDKVAESVEVGELVESDSKPVTEALGALLTRHPGVGLTVEGRGARVNRVIDVLIHKFVYAEATFGTQNEFIEMMIRIIKAMLQPT